MKLFGLEKKKEKDCCSCGCEAGAGAAADTCCGGSTDGICCIKVLGAGCRSCHEMYENACAAAEELGLSLKVEYITDMEKVMACGVMSMPALVVNEQVAAHGRVMKKGEILKILQKYKG